VYYDDSKASYGTEYEKKGKLKMYKKNAGKALIPFWIYFGSLVIGDILFFICPLILFLFFPIALLCVILWIVIVYLVGNAVQKRTRQNKLWKRAGTAFVCSSLVVLIFPASVLIDDYIKWNRWYLGNFLDSFTDITVVMILVIHILVFWIGEEMQRLEARTKKEDFRDGT
jgi:hypothetical protein